MFKRVHFIGIKGVGMSALAQLFHYEGAIISGSDTQEEFHTDKNLSALGITSLPFNANNVKENLDLVVYSRAYTESHPEIKKARKLNIPIMDYGEALAFLFNRKKKGIVICGTAGKTTTTAMVAKIFEDAGFSPTALVGGQVLDWQSNAKQGKGEFFITEGDEYQEKFLKLNPYVVLITNIQYDHPDFFPNIDNYKSAFRKLVAKINPQGICAVFDGDQNAINISANFPGKKIVFGPTVQPDILNKLKLKLLGHHNRINALGAFVLAEKFGIPQKTILESLAGFSGINRRLEHYNSPENKILIIDDYAHHPIKILASIHALKEEYPERKIATVFHPHTFSRTEALLDGFVSAFNEVDFLAVADIYSSAREKIGKITSPVLVDKIREMGVNAVYTPAFSDVHGFFKKIASSCIGTEKYIFLTMGAGDIWKVARELKNEYNF